MTALRALAVATIVLGIAYTFAVTGVAQLLLPAQASGSLVERDGEVVGSALIGQSWLDAEGEPLPEWFQGRPSAAGDGYDGGASSGSNLGPEHPDLIAAIAERRAAIAAFEGVEEATIPADALTASGSGLDPHISPEYALLQAPRVAEARELPTAEVVELVERRIAPRDLGILGQPRVNVLELNLALDELAGR
nr:potassium-transporting ATPase subunit KdpC [Agrococcus sp. ARC_14]